MKMMQFSDIIKRGKIGLINDDNFDEIKSLENFFFKII